MPVKDELVMATIVKYQENHGYHVTLDEYDDKEALLVISNLHNGREGGALSTYCRIGSKHVLLVTDVSPAGIDLSKKDVNPKDETTFQKYFDLTNKFIGTVMRLSKISSVPLEELYENIIWIVLHKDFSAPLEDHVFNRIKYRENVQHILTGKYAELIITYHERIYGKNLIKREHNFTLICFSIYGKDRVQKILSEFSSKWHEYSEEELYLNSKLYNVKLNILAIPQYTITTQSVSEETAVVANGLCGNSVLWYG